MDYDIIVIGSGLGGLTSASRLSNLGYKVGVFEQHFTPGGYATNFKRKGYNFDVSLHGIGGLEEGGNVYKILSACNIIDRITPIKSDISYSIYHNNELMSIPNNIDEYKTVLIKKFKTEEKNIEKLFKDLYRFDNGFKKFILQKDENFINKIHKDVLLFIKWSSKTTYQVLRNYTRNEELIKVFTALWSYYGLPPKDLSAIYYFIPWNSYHMHGKYYIKGGSQSLSDAFVENIKENKGDIYLRKSVESILYENNKVCGVKLQDGQVFKSKWIISNVNPIKTYEMLPKYALNKIEIKKIKEDKIGCTLSQLYIGLDINPNELNIPNDEVFFFGEGSHEEDYKISLDNRYEKSGFLLTNYNSMDKMLNEENKGVLTMTYIDNYDYWSNDRGEYKSQKKEVIYKMINRLEKYYKGISNHIVVAELGTPKTMERYTLNPKGAVYGYNQSVKQSGRYRLKNKSSISNLSFVGAWTNPGGGYEGSISGGMVEANRIRNILPIDDALK
ncbi:MAG: NAD(P)/FAD-dependent oxidoreductase [Romboutsia sp.]